MDAPEHYRQDADPHFRKTKNPDQRAPAGVKDQFF
jgi:hypothetical protein